MKYIYYLLPLIAGMGLTMQVGLNGKLRNLVGSPVIASFISFVVGSLGLGIIAILNIISGNENIPSLITLKQGDWWIWLGGLFGAFYIFISIFTSPKIGFASMFSLVITGQILLAVWIDHFGLLGNIVHEISSLRMIGIVFLILGVYFIQTN